MVGERERERRKGRRERVDGDGRGERGELDRENLELFDWGMGGRRERKKKVRRRESVGRWVGTARATM